MVLSCARPARVPGSTCQSTAAAEADLREVPSTRFAFQDDTGATRRVELSLYLDAGAARVPHPVDYLFCEGPRACRPLARLDANEPIYGTLPSPSGRFEIIVHGDPAVADVFDLRSGAQAGTFADGGWMRAWHNGALTWLGEERILAHWGAGTYVGVAALYDRTGDELLSVGADVVSVDPRREFLAAFTPAGAPGPEAGHLQMYDLRAADPSTPLPLPPSAEGVAPIADLLFADGYVVVLLETEVDGSFTRVDITLAI